MIWRLRAVNYPPSSFLFLKNRIESTAESIASIGAHYGVNGKLLSTQYKEYFSDYCSWDQLGHAQDWLLFEDNIGESISIDKTCLSSSEVYTFLTNKAGKGRKGTLVAVVKGTKAEDVIQVLKKINLSKRKTVKEITLDLSSSMMRIAHSVFFKALITNDRFHVQKLYYDALDDMRIAYRWMARDKENEEIK